MSRQCPEQAGSIIKNIYYTHLRATSVDTNNGTNGKFYRKVAILMYTEMFNFRPQS